MKNWTNFTLLLVNSFRTSKLCYVVIIVIYFSIGIPWVPRKMMTASSPTIEISVVDGVWTIKTSTLMSNSSVTFKLGEEYIETMPGGRTIKVPTVASNFFFHYLIFSLFKQNVTTVEDNKLITNSQSDRGASTK